MRAAVARGRTNTLEILASPQSRRGSGDLRQAARLAFKHAGTEQLLGIDDDGVVFAEMDRFLRAGRTNLFVNLGLNPGTGAVADAARFQAIPLQILTTTPKTFWPIRGICWDRGSMATVPNSRSSARRSALWRDASARCWWANSANDPT